MPEHGVERCAVKLLHFSDLHLDAPFGWAGALVGAARRRALRQSLERIAHLAATLGVDALCSAGDLYEQDRFTPDTAAFLADCFAALAPLPVLLAPGNHDWYGPQSLYHLTRWSPNVHIFTTPQLTPWTLSEGCTIWGAAHRAPANTDGFLENFHVDRGGVHLALFHGSEQGSFLAQGSTKAPHAPFRAKEVPVAGLHHALVGHFHRPADGAFHTYPGNPEFLSFGETGERGPVLVTVAANGTVTRRRYVVTTTAVHDLTLRVDGAAHSTQIQDRARALLAQYQGITRLTVEGTLAPSIDVTIDVLRREEVAPHLDALVVRLGHIAVAEDLAILAKEATVRGAFVRNVQAAEMDEVLRSRVLRLGLRALDATTAPLEIN